MPNRRARLLVGAALAAAALLVVAFVARAALRGGGGADVDCARFRPTPQRWASGDGDARRDLMDGIETCDRIAGRPASTVERLIGPPDRRSSREIDYDLPLGDAGDREVWRIFLDDAGRVKATQLEQPETGVPR